MTEIKRRKQIKFSRFVTWMILSMGSEAPIVKSKHTTVRKKIQLQPMLEI